MRVFEELAELFGVDPLGSIDLALIAFPWLARVHVGLLLTRAGT